MKRIKLCVAYEGTDFAGWQVQPEMHGKRQRTVQGELESAILALTGLSVRVHGSGRTDAGVHADCQVAHFDVPASLRINWQRAFHAKLPHDIAVVSAEVVPETFHARFSCCGKKYVYTLWTESSYLPPKLRRFVWACGAVDWDLVDQASKVLIGEHNFAAVQNTGAKPGDTVREIYSIQQVALAFAVHESSKNSPYVQLHFHGNGFLKQMVRNLVGFLVWVGQKKLDVSAAKTLLYSDKRNCLDFPTAPACGLTLQRVLYPVNSGTMQE